MYHIHMHLQEPRFAIIHLYDKQTMDCFRIAWSVESFEFMLICDYTDFIFIFLHFSAIA